MKLKKIATVIDWELIRQWEEYIRDHQEKERRRKRYGSKKRYRAKEKEEF